MPDRAAKASPQPYDAEGLERIALGYVGRYATTRHKLSVYLNRKLRERGWAGDGQPAVESLVERMAVRGYVNDGLFAEARTASLLRRGYGGNRIDLSLRAAGIDHETRSAMREGAEDAAEQAAIAFARRRRLGPYSQKARNPDENRRALAAMIRAGHGFELARRVLGANVSDDDTDY